MPDVVKEAFRKVKEDIDFLKNQLIAVSIELQEIKRILTPTDRQTDQPTHTSQNQTANYDKPTDQQTTYYNLPQRVVKTPISNISIGNEGVPTDRQTDQQTDRQIHKFAQSKNFKGIGNVAVLLNSLDLLKKDIRSQFQKLTAQEMLIFSTIYSLEEQGFVVDYPLLASKTNLTESSVRDYTLKLLKKSIPLEKRKENNKRIILTIPTEFRKIAP